jgi:hypothetical protein
MSILLLLFITYFVSQERTGFFIAISLNQIQYLVIPSVAILFILLANIIITWKMNTSGPENVA